MKNHIKNFGQFVNEMAKGDYFQSSGLKHGDSSIYGLHRDGSSDWMMPGDQEWKEKMEHEPDEELTADEFLARHAEELGPHGAAYLNRERTPDSRVKVWRKKADSTAIQKMSIAELELALDTLDKGIKKAVFLKASPSSIQKLKAVRSNIISELESRGND